MLVSSSAANLRSSRWISGGKSGRTGLVEPFGWAGVGSALAFLGGVSLSVTPGRSFPKPYQDDVYIVDGRPETGNLQNNYLLQREQC
jgi:hypothetical protein